MSGFGPAIVDGKIVYTSATQLDKADARQEGGCEQKWVFEYREGKKPPKTQAMIRGVDVHAEIDEYLPTGRLVLGPIAMAMRPYLPLPGADIRVELDLWRIPGLPMLEIEGIPVVGRIDWEHERGTHRGGADIEDTEDPPGTVEVGDNKTTSDFQWAKAPEALIKTVQMPLYGEASAQRRAREGREPMFIRLSHVIGRTRGAAAARKASKLHTRDEIRTAYEGIRPVARRLKELAAGAAPVGNKLACGAFRGCPHRDYCPTYNHDSLGDDLADVIAALNGETEEQTMSVLDSLNLSPDVQDAMGALVAAEAPKALAVPQEFRDAMAVIQRAQMPAARGGGPAGFPNLAGEAAAMWAAMQAPPVIVPPGGTTFAATGHLAKVPVRNTVADVLALAADMIKAGLSTPEPSAAAVSSPVTTPSGSAAPPVQAAPQPVQGGPGGSIVLPADAPTSKPELAADPVPGFGGTPAGPQVTEQASANAEPEKKKRGRPKKTDTAGAAPAERGDALEIFVNAIPARPFESLDGYVRGLTAALEKKYGLADLRLAVGDHPLAFSRWKGAVTNIARESPPAKGTYVSIAPDEITEIVIDALRFEGLIDEYVRGVR